LFPGFTVQSIKTSGATINVLKGGEGPPLLLLHGHPETHVTWHKIASDLARNYSVIIPDLRGYGDSSKPDGGERHVNYSFRAMALDQVETMRHFGHERFLVGVPRWQRQPRLCALSTSRCDGLTVHFRCGPDLNPF
jgi:haloacetate dehalogenase